MTPSRSGPWRGSLPSLAISRMVADSSSTRWACSTMRSPTGVTLTSTLPRSKSCTSSSSSSFLMATDRVGWLTKQASAARPKCRSRATATMYFSSVKVIEEFYLRLGTERSTFRRLPADRTTESPPAKTGLNAARQAAQASRKRSRRRSQRSRCASTTSGRASSSRSDRAWAMSTSGASRPRSAKRSSIAPD